MLHANNVGPWPIIDIDSSQVAASGSFTQASLPSTPDLHLGGNSLGSMNEFYYAGLDNNSRTVTAGNQVGYAGCLAPLTGLTVEYELPVMMDFSFHAVAKAAGALHILPFIGYIDVEENIAAGWDADNELQKYSLLPCQVMPQESYVTGISGSLTTQVVLKNVNSIGLPIDHFIAAGFFIRNNVGSNIAYDDLEFMISARYSYSPVSLFTRY